MVLKRRFSPPARSLFNLNVPHVGTMSSYFYSRKMVKTKKESSPNKVSLSVSHISLFFVGISNSSFLADCFPTTRTSCFLSHARFPRSHERFGLHGWVGSGEFASHPEGKDNECLSKCTIQYYTDTRSFRHSSARVNTEPSSQARGLCVYWQFDISLKNPA
jgi:hypothetical protein